MTEENCMVNAPDLNCWFTSVSAWPLIQAFFPLCFREVLAAMTKQAARRRHHLACGVSRRCYGHMSWCVCGCTYGLSSSYCCCPSCIWDTRDWVCVFVRVVRVMVVMRVVVVVILESGLSETFWLLSDHCPWTFSQQGKWHLSVPLYSPHLQSVCIVCLSVTCRR